MNELNPKNKDVRIAATVANRPRITTRELFAAQSEVIIEHQGEEYRLRITSNGKLILTK
ncbi:hemin uptake protein HemP [Methylomonas sp. HW2-6]|uniref:hemin uptake protein HemP n=1 Tax=Methylomonas sp. HW2-6 TaxID=3376687 RepID=UPI0040421D43